MYDSIIILQQQYLHLKHKQKSYGSEAKIAALECQLRNIEKAIRALVLIHNNLDSFNEWAKQTLDSNIANDYADNHTKNSDKISMFLRRQAE